MRTIVLFALAAASLLAGIPSNAVKLTNSTGTSVNQPITISRVFADGEICHYPQPVGISQWQADVKTHWASGCVQHAMISFWPGAIADTATSTITFVDNVNPCHLGNVTTCNAAALDQSGILAFNSASWGAAIQVTPLGLSTHQSSAVQMITDGNFHYWLRGPIATVVVAEDKSSARAYDFSYTCTNCLAIALSSSTVDTTADTFNVTGHNLTNGTNVTIPWSGTLPGGVDYTKTYYVVNATTNTFQLSLTNGGAAIDLTTTGSSNMNLYPTAMSAWTWTPDSNKCLHPMFILTMYPGWAGVKVDYILENASTIEQEQEYQLSLLSGRTLATTKFTFLDNSSNTYTPHYIRTRWRKTFWDGTAPATLKVDLGTEYVQYSKIIPRIDSNLTTADSSSTITGVSSHLSNGAVPFNCDYAYSNGLQNCVNWQMYFPSTGGRTDIGIYPGWYVDYLRLWDPAMLSAILTMADVAGIVPLHLREYSTTKYYDEAQTTLAFGRPVSTDARPSWAPVAGNATSGADAIAFNGVWINSGWTVDDAHHADMTTLPYLLTGDYFYLEEMQFMAAYQITNSNAANTNGLCRNGAWGVINNGQIRAWGWKFRTVGHAAAFSPDTVDNAYSGTPEKTYFRQKLDYSAAVEEGVLGIKDGNFYDSACLSSTINTFSPSSSNTKWCWGRLIIGTMPAELNPLHLSFPGTQDYTPGHTELDATDWTSCGSPDLTNGANWSTAYSSGCKTFYGVSPWMVHYDYGVFGHLTELGLDTITPLARWAAKDIVAKVADSNFAPTYNLAQYHEPSLKLVAPLILAADITTTSKTLTLTAPAPAYANTPGALIKVESETMRVCSASGSTITLCTTGGRSPFGYGTAAHSAGAPVMFLLPFTSLSSMKSAFQYTAPSTWTPAGWYADIAVSALALLEPYHPQGLAAWTAAAGALGAPRIYNAFGYKYRREPVTSVSVEVGDTFAIIRYTAPTSGQTDSACTVDGVSDGQSNARARYFVKTGLTAATPYTSTINCTADPYGSGNTTVNYTTAAAFTGTKTYSITVGGNGGTTAYLDYGSTSALGSTVSASCSSGCTLTTPALSKGILYYRLRSSTGASGPTQALTLQ